MRKKRILILSLISAILLSSCGISIKEKDVQSAVNMYDVESGAYMISSEAMNNGLYCIDDSSKFNTEEFDSITENGFTKVSTQPLSTFAADVDTGMYCNIRKKINNGMNIEEIKTMIGSAIRTEELINYFDYSIKNASDGKFTVQYETNVCPWNTENDLLFMAVQANELDMKYNGSNFVFLIDTSGSMNSKDKLPMAIESFKLLAKTLNEEDTVSVVTYAGDFNTILDGCNGSQYEKIEKALESLESGGGTNGSGGITEAYKIAEKHFIEGGNNRVIIASDGDMNLGITTNAGLTDLIREKKETGVFLTVLGFGNGNYSDYNMEQIADAGNGNYFYIDCIEEAKNVLIDKLKQTTVTVAKDVKFQAEFNPAVVSKYRLIGYENRTMAADDFKDDTKDGGEVGAGQQVTILYELSYDKEIEDNEELKYQETPKLSEEALKGDILTLSINYKEPTDDSSVTESYVVVKTNLEASEDFCFAAGVTEFSMILRGSDYINEASLNEAYKLCNLGTKNNLQREEFCDLLIKLGADDDYRYSFPIKGKETKEMNITIFWEDDDPEISEIVDMLNSIDDVNVLKISSSNILLEFGLDEKKLKEKIKNIFAQLEVEFNFN